MVVGYGKMGWDILIMYLGWNDLMRVQENMIFQHRIEKGWWASLIHWKYLGLGIACTIVAVTV